VKGGIIKMKNLKKFMISSAILASISLIAPIPSYAQRDLKDTVYNQIEEKILKYSSVKSDLFPSNGKTGQRAEFIITLPNTFQGEGEENYMHAKDIRIYEDGKEIEYYYTKKTKFSAYNTFFHKEPGKHSYFAECIFEDGKIIRTETKAMEFTGEILDIPPEKAHIELKGRQKNFLYIRGEDYGDNQGIKKIEIYKDKNLWKTFNFEKFIWSYPNTASKMIHLKPEDLENHEYFAKIIDAGENEVQTETIFMK